MNYRASELVKENPKVDVSGEVFYFRFEQTPDETEDGYHFAGYLMIDGLRYERMVLEDGIIYAISDFGCAPVEPDTMVEIFELAWPSPWA